MMMMIIIIIIIRRRKSSMCEITAQWLSPHFLTCAIILRQGISDEVSRDSSVGIATGYGLIGLGIESWCGRELP